MSENENPPSESYPCLQCHAGILLPRFVAYFTWLGNELIIVPNFPAWVCDVCGKCEYDEKAVLWIDMILDPNAGKPTKNRGQASPFPRPPSHAPRSILDS